MEYVSLTVVSYSTALYQSWAKGDSTSTPANTVLKVSVCEREREREGGEGGRGRGRKRGREGGRERGREGEREAGRETETVVLTLFLLLLGEVCRTNRRERQEDNAANQSPYRTNPTRPHIISWRNRVSKFPLENCRR